MAIPATTVTFQRLSWADTMLGVPTGRLLDAPVGSHGGARTVLENTIRAALDAGRQSYVLFSGGRDSSAVLALAVHVARREGLPEPVPVTVYHPDSPESHESDWQDLVLEHLRVRDRLVVTMRGDQSLLGPAATEAIRRRGPVWPAAAQVQGALYRTLEPGVVISGEGGDGVIDGHRMGTIRRALTRPRRHSLREALSALRPAPATRRSLAAEMATPGGGLPNWLRSPARTACAEAVAKMLVQPLRWDAAIRTVARSPIAVVGLANFAGAVTEHGSVSVNPLLDLDFVDALAHDGGATGWGDRTAIFRHLVGDLLPSEILSRSSKASFNSTRWGERERQFAQEWDGTGFDDTWIDAEALRREWLSDRPLPLSGFLLQAAWALSEGIPVTDGAQ